MAKITYSVSGSVRGDCGHKHRSIKTARRCYLRDHKGCQSQGGYSDRTTIHAYEGDDPVPLEHDDYYLLKGLEAAAVKANTRGEDMWLYFMGYMTELIDLVEADSLTKGETK